MFDLRLDLRDAWRSLRGSWVLTLSAVTTLALGIGLTTSIFSVVNGVVLRPLPFPNEGRLITLCEQHPSATPDWCSISPPNIEDIAARSRAIEAIGIGRHWSYSLALSTGSETIESGLASPGLFRAVGARVQMGRLIVASDLIGRQCDVALLGAARCFSADDQSVMRSLISSELPRSSGAYIASARAGKALNWPGISALMR